MARIKDRNGFTLVELLVVIGIIAVLIAILLPALSAVRKAAQAVACMSNMKQWGMAMQMYVDQNKGILPQKGPAGNPAASGFTPANGVTGFDDQSVWFNALPPYMAQTPYAQMVINWATGAGAAPPYAGGGASIWICPSSLGPAPLLQGSPMDTPFAGGSPFPSQSETHYWQLWGTASTANLSVNGKVKTTIFPFFSSYLINSKLGKTVDAQLNTTTRTKINISQLTPSSEVVTMVESLAFAYEDTDAVVQQWVSGVPGWVQTNTKVDQYGYTSNVSQSGADWTRLTCRHNHGGHILFADGHVSHYGWPEVQITQDQIARGSNLADWNQYGRIVWSPFGRVQ